MSRLATVARRIELKQDVLRESARALECNAEINECHASTNKNQEEYDKQLLTLSSSLLVLSLAFIKDIVPLPDATHKGLLFFSFVILTLCVFTVLASYQISNLGLSRAKRYWEKKRDGDETARFPETIAILIRIWNVFTGLLFTVGIVLTVSFVVINLRGERKMSDKPTNLQEGSNLRVPAKGTPEHRGANLKTPPPPPPPPTSKK